MRINTRTMLYCMKCYAIQDTRLSLLSLSLSQSFSFSRVDYGIFDSKRRSATEKNIYSEISKPRKDRSGGN